MTNTEGDAREENGSSAGLSQAVRAARTVSLEEKRTTQEGTEETGS